MPNSKVLALTPPNILAQVPKKFLKALDVSRVFHEALLVTDHKEPLSLIIALDILESYFDAAKLEQHRIARAQRLVWKHKNSLFHDVHFYLISWARIAKLARFIRDETRFKRTGLVIRQYNTELDKRIGGRDHLEHFEERLPGGPKQAKLKVPNDLLNMANDYLTYGGYKIDVGPSSIQLLQKFVEEFHMALLFDSVEVIELANPNRLTELFQQAASSIWLNKITKAAKKQLRTNK